MSSALPDEAMEDRKEEVPDTGRDADSPGTPLMCLKSVGAEMFIAFVVKGSRLALGRLRNAFLRWPVMLVFRPNDVVECGKLSSCDSDIIRLSAEGEDNRRAMSSMTIEFCESASCLRRSGVMGGGGLRLIVLLGFVGGEVVLIL